MKLSQLQAEHAVWLQKMYPGQPAMLPMAGMIEEAAELLHALLAQYREQQWGPDPRYKNIAADIVDAVGDCVIYFCSLCNTQGLELAVFDCDALKVRHNPIGCAVSLVGTAAHFYLSGDEAEAHAYIATLKTICSQLELDFEACYTNTWLKVKERTR